MIRYRKMMSSTFTVVYNQCQDWRNGVRRSCTSPKLAGDHANYEAICFHMGNCNCLDILVARFCHLVRTRKVNPELDKFKIPTFPDKIGGGAFTMQNAA